MKRYPKSDMNSDHNPVVSTIRLVFKRILKATARFNITWKCADQKTEATWGIDRQPAKVTAR